MSDLAIAAVTATLRHVIYSNVTRSRAVNIDNITTLPPDKANQGDTSRRLNLFLYHVSHNAAWRNQVIPTRVRPGETAYPPLALTLHYLLTAYGDDTENETDHELLGAAMRAMHDHPVLTREDIRGAAGNLRAPLDQEHLERQFEPVRLTPETLSVDEMSKLWATFQTQYRVSTSYQASVVLLESAKPTRTPLPVLMRGENDVGVDVTPGFPPLLDGIEYRDLRTQQVAMTAAQLNDFITIRGSQLPGMRSEVVVRDPNRQVTPARPTADIIARLKPENGSSDERVIVKLDETAGSWVAGSLQIFIESKTSQGKTRRSVPLPLAMAPSISNSLGLAGFVTPDRKLIIRCNPPVSRLPDRSLPEILLLLAPTGAGDPPTPIPVADRKPDAPADELTFDVSKVQPGEYRVRVRIETVESLMVKRNGYLISFDELQTVRL